jgi:hypothetical protein
LLNKIIVSPVRDVRCTFREAETVATDESLRHAFVFICATRVSPPPPTSTESVKHGTLIFKCVDCVCVGLNFRAYRLCQAGTKVA